eukprot:GHVQ01004554.1.p1 GENE.GHVQ01004554.1~~GHVQ01004554.1.p1  ORF type:complete len:1054 (+),score=92.40 GHVQ01004554.1:3795-6956(+)
MNQPVDSAMNREQGFQDSDKSVGELSDIVTTVIDSSSSVVQGGVHLPTASAGVARPHLLTPPPGTPGELEAGLTEATESLANFQTDELGYSWSACGLTDVEAEERRIHFGYNEVKTSVTPEWIKVLKRYTALVPVILIIAAVLSVSVTDADQRRDWLSFGLLFVLVNITVWADFFSDRNAKDAIKAVENLSAPECLVKRNNVFNKIPVRDLVPGDIVELRAGVVVPADGKIVGDGEPMSVDESSLTGESLAVTKRENEELLSGAVILRGERQMVVTKTGEHSFYGKTISLLGQASTVGHLRQILNRAAKIITFTASVFALFLFCWLVFATDQKHSWLLSLKKAFIIVASVVPAAMPVVTTTVLAVGAVQMSKEHAVVNRLSAIEEAAGMEVLCSDKTGTLTKNSLTLYRDEIVCQPGVSVDELLLMASLASSVQHAEPIDQAINNEVDSEKRSRYKIVRYLPFNPVDKRTLATVIDPDNQVLHIAKGAPHVIRDMVAQGDVSELNRLDRIINSKAERGLRTLGVCTKYEDGDNSAWNLLGYIALYDPPRDDTIETIRRAAEMGIDVKMITGDQQAIAIETARQLHMGTNIVGPEIWSVNQNGVFLGQRSFSDFVLTVNGFSGVFPEHKFHVVNALLKMGKLVGMTGDGVNDAPALKLATVGIAVAGATDAAKAAADIILLQPGMSPIITAFTLSRQIFRRIEAYIIFRVFTSMLILVFYWTAIVFLNYEFPSWTLVLISMINDFTLMTSARDRVPSSPTPLKWDMVQVTVVASLMSLINVTSCVLLLANLNPTLFPGFWGGWGLDDFPTESENHTYTNAAMWLLLTMMIQLNYYSARTKTFFFIFDGKNACVPSLFVVVPQVISVCLTFLLVVLWPVNFKLGSGTAMTGIPLEHALVVLLWSLLSFFLTDILKVLAYKIYSVHWNDFNLVQLLNHKTGEQIQHEQTQQLNDIRRKELNRRYEEQASIGRKVTEQRTEIIRRIASETLQRSCSMKQLPADSSDNREPLSYRPAPSSQGMLSMRLDALEKTISQLSDQTTYILKLVHDVLEKQRP